MQCPLCDAENNEQATLCHVCDTTLTEVLFHEEDQPKKTYGPLLFSIFFALALFAALPWFLRSNTLTQPERVLKSRELFQNALTSYQAKKSQWSETKDLIKSQVNHLESHSMLNRENIYLDDIPFEVLVAYLYEELNWGDIEHPNAMLSPIFTSQDTTTFLLTKADTSVWPIQPLASIDISLRSSKDNGLEITYANAKLGDQSISIQRALEIFHKELSSLSGLEVYAEGFRSFSSETKKNAPGDSLIPVTFTWEQGPYIERPTAAYLPVR